MEFIDQAAGKRNSIIKIIVNISLFIILLFLPYNSPAMAGDATLTWDPNTDTITAGYKVYYGTVSKNYITSVNVGNQTTYTVTGLASDTYYFAVTAYDSSGNESGYSNEGSKTLGDSTAPVLSAIGASNFTGSSATVSWTTNEASDSQVQYGTTTAYGSSTSLNTTLVTSHSQSLTGLQASTLYHYRVLSRDAAGNLATSGDNTFTTSATPDTTPPVISGITASNISNAGATIAWSTNEAASSQVEYGTTTSYGSSTTLNSTPVTSHGVALTGLQASTLYHYRVLSRDAAGNLATSADNSFTTTTTPDTTPPVLSLIDAGPVTGNSATITWETNEPATSQVDYGLTAAYGEITTLDATLSNSHSQILTGLLPSTVYYYRVTSADSAGNLSLSADHVFATGSASDTTPPGNVQNFTAQPVDQQILLSWTNPSDPDFVGVRIMYRTDRYPSDINDGTLLGDFSGQPNEVMNATQLPVQGGLTYYYSASSYDASGNYQHTAYTSVTVPFVSSGTGDSGSTSVSGGCGMIDPKNGKPSGPAQAADMVGFLAAILIAILKGELKRKKTFDRFKGSSGIILVLDYLRALITVDSASGIIPCKLRSRNSSP